ncbi:pseudo histidine-containing phosphotransfer protein 2-like [Humulus lupulus]|uniref:pseudo histidine-containing phosphotransfer protein 2-like n=1 Tax=Humulus lupulus TaxID=3486 RepID=UPI002B41018F|nr:pseudo histidine-containing phosphotransfer protein 2-like [Humulus lupulus]
MDRSNQMRKQIAVMRQSLFDQGFLDEQFIKLEDLQDDANPNFVEEVATEIHLESSITWTKHWNIIGLTKGGCLDLLGRILRKET